MLKSSAWQTRAPRAWRARLPGSGISLGSLLYRLSPVPGTDPSGHRPALSGHGPAWRMGGKRRPLQRSHSGRKTFCRVPGGGGPYESARWLPQAKGSLSTGLWPGIRRTVPPNGCSTKVSSEICSKCIITMATGVHCVIWMRKSRFPPTKLPGKNPKVGGIRAARGGGSLLDYLGYGVTLGTWFHAGRAPLEVTCVVDETPGLELDEHSVTIARYDCGLSKFETRWSTFTDPLDTSATAEMWFCACRLGRNSQQL